MEGDEEKLYKLTCIEKSTGCRGVCAVSGVEENNLCEHSKQVIPHPIDGKVYLAVVHKDHLYALYELMYTLLPNFEETHAYMFESGYATEEETSVHF